MTPRRRSPRPGALLLTPGAGADATHHTLVAVDEAVTAKVGLTVGRVDFPYRKAGRRAPDKAPVAVAHLREEAAALVAEAGVAAEQLVLGGRSLHNARMGVHHGLSQLLGGRTGIPHGLANALVLPHAMRFNADEVPEELRRIGRALGDEDDPAGAVERLRDRIGLPSQLSDVGVEDDDLAAVARLSQQNASVRLPRWADHSSKA